MDGCVFDFSECQEGGRKEDKTQVYEKRGRWASEGLGGQNRRSIVGQT